MKEFERWWETNRESLPNDEFGAFKVVWKDALEWVLSNGTRSNQVSGIFLSVLDMIKIEEELHED